MPQQRAGKPRPYTTAPGLLFKRLPQNREGIFMDEGLEHHGAIGCIQDTSI